MGLLFVLMAYAIVCSIAATVAACVLGFVAWQLIPARAKGRRKAIMASVVFPYGCIVFAGCWFFAYSTINYACFHRDPMLGDDWETPLPNGYSIGMIDTTDEGIVYATRAGMDNVSIQPTAAQIRHVRSLQLAGHHLYGSRQANGDSFSTTTPLESSIEYFDVDTEKLAYTAFHTQAELQYVAQAEGSSLVLRPLETVYSMYRFTWFDYCAGGILILLPTLGAGCLMRLLWKTRNSTDHTPLDPIRATPCTTPPWLIQHDR